MQKILVEIIGENGVKSRKKYPIEENHVVIRKRTRGRGPPGYKVPLNKDCILTYYVGVGIFKRTKRKLLLKENASEFVNFYSQERVETPTVNMKSLRDYSQASVIKFLGATVQRIQVPTLLYVVIAGVIFLQVINLLVSSGRVHIG